MSAHGPTFSARASCFPDSARSPSCIEFRPEPDSGVKCTHSLDRRRVEFPAYFDSGELAPQREFAAISEIGCRLLRAAVPHCSIYAKPPTFQRVGKRQEPVHVQALGPEVRELKADGLLPADTKLRSSKYLNNLIEHDHRGMKQSIAVMLGFKRFKSAVSNRARGMSRWIA